MSAGAMRVAAWAAPSVSRCQSARNRDSIYNSAASTGRSRGHPSTSRARGDVAPAPRAAPRDTTATAALESFDRHFDDRNGAASSRLAPYEEESPYYGPDDDFEDDGADDENPVLFPVTATVALGAWFTYTRKKKMEEQRREAKVKGEVEPVKPKSPPNPASKFVQQIKTEVTSITGKSDDGKTPKQRYRERRTAKREVAEARASEAEKKRLVRREELHEAAERESRVVAVERAERAKDALARDAERERLVSEARVKAAQAEAQRDAEAKRVAEQRAKLAAMSPEEKARALAKETVAKAKEAASKAKQDTKAESVKKAQAHAKATADNKAAEERAAAEAEKKSKKAAEAASKAEEKAKANAAGKVKVAQAKAKAEQESAAEKAKIASERSAKNAAAQAAREQKNTDAQKDKAPRDAAKAEEAASRKAALELKAQETEAAAKQKLRAAETEAKAAQARAAAQKKEADAAAKKKAEAKAQKDAKLAKEKSEAKAKAAKASAKSSAKSSDKSMSKRFQSSVAGTKKTAAEKLKAAQSKVGTSLPTPDGVKGIVGTAQRKVTSIAVTVDASPNPQIATAAAALGVKPSFLIGSGLVFAFIAVLGYGGKGDNGSYKSYRDFDRSTGRTDRDKGGFGREQQRAYLEAQLKEDRDAQRARWQGAMDDGVNESGTSTSTPERTSMAPEQVGPGARMRAVFGLGDAAKKADGETDEPVSNERARLEKIREMNRISGDATALAEEKLREARQARAVQLDASSSSSEGTVIKRSAKAQKRLEQKQRAETAVLSEYSSGPDGESDTGWDEREVKEMSRKYKEFLKQSKAKKWWGAE